MFIIIAISLAALWVTSGVVYYTVPFYVIPSTRAPSYINSQRKRIWFRPFIAVWALWLEFAYIRVENGQTQYKDSLKKWWSHFSHFAFHTSWVIKAFYPLWATAETLATWQMVAGSISDVLILGLASHSVALATAYHFGKKQELAQYEASDLGEQR